jgi:hypothetical protein
MQLNPNLMALWAIVFAFGVALLLLTFIGPALLIVVGIGVAGYIGYLLYKAGKDQGLF